MEALKTAIHILNRVPSKSVPKTPYELWTGRKSTLNYLHVWGCPAEAKVFNQNIGNSLAIQKSRKVIVSTVQIDTQSL